MDTNHSSTDPGYLYPNVDQIRDMDLRLRYLTHDARRVIEQSKLQDDLNMYWQTILIELCCNHKPERVLLMLKPKKKKELPPVPGEGYVTRDVSKGTPFSNDPAANSFVSILKKGRSKTLGEAFRNASFTPKAIWNLYLIDSLLLISDYWIRIEELVTLLDKIDGHTIEALAARYGRIRMNSVVARIEEHLGMVEEEIRMLSDAQRPSVDPVQTIDPEANKKFEIALQDLKESKEDEGV